MLWLALSFPLTVFSNKITDTTYLKAIELLGKQDYESAATLFEQSFFYSSDSLTRLSSLLKRAECFKQKGNYIKVEQTLKRIEMASLSDSVKATIFYERSFALFNLNLYKEAETLLSQIYSLPLQNETTNFSLFLHGLVLNELGNYKEASNRLNEFVTQNTNYPDSIRLALTEVIKESYAKNNLPKLKSLKKARTLSTFLPGSGLIYAGYRSRGATNTVLVTAATLYIVFNILTETYITASTAGLHVFLLMYTGGINQLDTLVYQGNKSKTDAFNQKVKDVLLSKITQKSHE